MSLYVIWCFSAPFSPGFFRGWAGGGAGGTFFFIVPLLEYVNTEPPVFFSFVNIRRRHRRPTNGVYCTTAPPSNSNSPNRSFRLNSLSHSPSHRGIGKRTCHYREDPKRGGNPCLINSCHFYWRPMLAWHQDKGTFAAALQGPPNDALPFHPLFLLFFS